MKLSYGEVAIVRGAFKHKRGLIYKEGSIFYDLFIDNIRWYVKKTNCIKIPNSQ
jgi:hypothetical protein